MCNIIKCLFLVSAIKFVSHLKFFILHEYIYTSYYLLDNRYSRNVWRLSLLIYSKRFRQLFGEKPDFLTLALQLSKDLSRTLLTVYRKIAYSWNCGLANGIKAIFPIFFTSFCSFRARGADTADLIRHNYTSRYCALMIFQLHSWNPLPRKSSSRRG